MKTLNELIRLENLAFQTNLRGDALQAEFERTKQTSTPPLYVHVKGKMRAFFQHIHDEIAASRSLRYAPPPPAFDVWMGEDGMELLKKDDKYSN